jgi:hypothetical protein
VTGSVVVAVLFGVTGSVVVAVLVCVSGSVVVAVRSLAWAFALPALDASSKRLSIMPLAMTATPPMMTRKNVAVTIAALQGVCRNFFMMRTHLPHFVKAD